MLLPIKNKKVHFLLPAFLILLSCTKQLSDKIVSADVKENLATARSARIFVCSANGTLYSINASDGSVVWSKKLTGECKSTPCFNNGTVFVHTRDTTFAVKAIDGSLVWKKGTGSFDGALCMEGNKLYLSNEKHTICLNAKNGNILWQSFGGNNKYVTAPSPTVVNGVVYISSNISFPTLYALNASSGALIWADSSFPTNASPCVNNNVVYLAQEGSAFGINAANGSTIWNMPLRKSEARSATLYNNRLFLGCGKAYALDPQTGTMLWDFRDTSSSRWGFNADIFAADNKVFATFNEHLYALNNTSGHIMWHKAIEKSQSPLIEDNDVLYYTGFYSGKLFAVNANTGEDIWSTTLTSGIDNYSECSPIIVKSSGEVIYPVRSGMRQ